LAGWVWLDEDDGAKVFQQADEHGAFTIPELKEILRIMSEDCDFGVK